MRTTVEISKSLLAEVRRIMTERNTTLRALVEDGLRRVVREEQTSSPPEMPDATFPGSTGFVPGVNANDLPEVIRAEIHHQAARR